RQAGGGDEEALVGRPFGESERALEGPCLRRRQEVEQAERGAEELVEPCEWQLRFRLDAADREHAHARRTLPSVREQRGLADPGLAAEAEHATPAFARRVEQSASQRLLVLPPVQHAPIVTSALSGNGARG